MTPNQLEVLRNLAPPKGRDREWLIPMFFGGRDGSHHSDTARRLAEQGYVECARRGAYTPYTIEQLIERKGKYRRGARGAPKWYRITYKGLRALKED